MNFTNRPLARLVVPMILTLASCPGIGLASHHQTPAVTQQVILVKLTCTNPIIHEGESIELLAEISNEGFEDVFIARDLQGVGNSISRLNLYLQHGSLLDSPRTHTAGDSFPGRKAPFANLFAKWWLALGPGHFYGQKITMSSSEFPQLKVPGRYRIRGEHTSHGFYLPTPNNPLQSYISELEALPYKPWEGSVETNSIWVEVRSKK